MTISEGQAISFTSGGLTLEGLLHLPESTPAPALVVCHPHPLYGGDMRNNVVHTLCKVANEAGLAALRFNFRGVGASEGTHDEGRGERDDVLAALDFLRSRPEVDSSRLALAGYSFGAMMALIASASAETRALVAVSLPTVMVLPEARPACPALFVSGDEDEYSDVDDLTDFVKLFGPTAEMVVLRGVDHFWWGSDDRLAETVSPFLKQHI